MVSDYIFVYGTLRRGFHNPVQHVLHRHSHFAGTGYIIGELYEINGYPGAVLSEDHNRFVHGEIYKIENSDELFLALDDYEGCSDQFTPPKEYKRKQVHVFTENGNPVKVWTYLYNWQVDNKKQIVSGNYADWRQSGLGYEPW